MPSRYTNTRPSLVSVGKLGFLPYEAKDVPDSLAEALEAKDKDGKNTHPLRRGHAPIFRPGVVEPPPARLVQSSPVLPEDENRAMTMVKLCDDLEILAGWTAPEHRGPVMAAIKVRAEQLAAKK